MYDSIQSELNQDIDFHSNENSQKYILRKSKKKDFTIIDNALIRDKRLSWKAKGILIYLLHLPDDWVICKKHLISQSTGGRESFQSGWNELRKFGYLTLETQRLKGQFNHCIWTVNETAEIKEDSKIPIEEELNKNLRRRENRPTETIVDGKPASTNTNTYQELKENNKPPNPLKGEASKDAIELSSFLLVEIKNINKEFLGKGVPSWPAQFDKILNIDGRKSETLKQMIVWIMQDSFWRSNILSPNKLREKYDQIKIRMETPSIKNNDEKNSRAYMNGKRMTEYDNAF